MTGSQVFGVECSEYRGAEKFSPQECWKEMQGGHLS